MELTEEERRRLSRPSFRMSGAGGRRPQGPLSTGLQGAGEAAATIGSAVLGSVPAGLAGLAALPFKGPQGAARAVEDVQEALTYVPRTQEGVKAVQGAVGPLSAMGAPAEYIGEKTRQATGSPALATAAEVVLDPLNLIGSAVAGKAAASGARAIGRGAKMAARELGPKAAEMAEGYMRRAGMMPQIFIGKSAKTWDAASNARAAEMEAAGIPAQTIWRETGNWRAPDGQWRQEISDAGVNLPRIANPITEAERIQYQKSVRRSEQIDKEMQKIFQRKNPDHAKIQKLQAESSKNSEFQIDFRKRAKGIASAKLGEVFPHEDLFAAYPQFQNLKVTDYPSEKQGSALIGEFEMRINPQARNRENIAIHELQHFIQDLEDFSPGGESKEYLKDTSKRLQELYKERDEALRPAKERGYYTEEEKAKLYEFVDRESALSPFGQYLRLQGEAEARAADRRMNLTPEERRAKFPEESYDVPIGELIDAPRTGRPAFAIERGDVTRMTTPELEAEAASLSVRVNQAYESGNQPLAERLDARLESVFDALEHRLAEVEEDGPAVPEFGGRERTQYLARVDEGSGDPEADLVRDLANRWKDMTTPGSFDASLSDAEKAANIRMLLDDYAFRHGGLREGLSDQQFLDAAKDAYDSVFVRKAQRQQSQGSGEVKKASDVAFKQFTGGAPVVSLGSASKHEFQTGKPVVIEGLHGTKFDFAEIDPARSSAGYFMTDRPVVADEYAGVYPEGMGGGSFPAGGNIQRSFVRMDNPLFVNARGASFNRIDTRGVPGFGLPMSNTDMLNQWAKQQGYDGVIYKDLRDSISAPGGRNAPASNVYVSFNPNYVKSAIGNRGTFDVREKDMTKAGGGAVGGNNMSFAGAADEIARKLVSQGMSQDQAMMLALRMSDARMKAGGAVMMQVGGAAKAGKAMSSALQAARAEARAVQAAQKAAEQAQRLSEMSPMQRNAYEVSRALAEQKTPITVKPDTVQRMMEERAAQIMQANPKLTEEAVAARARRDATRQLKWERQGRERLQKRYGELSPSRYDMPAQRKLRNLPGAVDERVQKAQEFLSRPTPPWEPPKAELQAFDRSLIKDALEGFPGIEQTRFPRYEAPRAQTGYIDEIYDDPRNRELIKQQIKRGLPLGGETFYASLYPVKVAAMERGIPAEKFDRFIYETAPASARNSILNEMAVGQFLRDMKARGLPLDEQTVKEEMARFKQRYGTGLPLMPVHREGVRTMVESGANMRDLLKADIPTNYKIPTYGTQKAGDFGKSMVLDVHEAAGQTQGSRFHPYFTEQGGFGPTEYGLAEGKMLDIAKELGIPGGMAQAGRWFGGGELTGLKSPRGDALDLLEKQAAYTLQGQGINPTPKAVRDYILNMVETGEGVLMPYFKSKPMPDYRTKKAEGGAVSKEEDDDPSMALIAEILLDMAKKQGKKEAKSLSKPRATTDLLNRGVVAPLAGMPVDLVNMGLEGVDAVRSLFGPVDTKLASEKPFLGSEYLKDLMDEYNMTSGEERPMMETGLSIFSPGAAIRSAAGAAESLPRAARAAESGINRATAAAARPFVPATVTMEAVAPDLAKFKPRQWQETATRRLTGPGAPVSMDVMGGQRTTKRPGQGVYENFAGDLETNPLVAIDVPRAGNLSTNTPLRRDIAQAGSDLAQESVAAHRFVPMMTNQIKDASAMLIKPKGGSLSNEQVIEMAKSLPGMIVAHNPRLGGVVVMPFDYQPGKIPPEFRDANQVARKVLGDNAAVTYGKADPVKDRLYIERGDYAGEGIGLPSAETTKMRQRLQRAEQRLFAPRQPAAVSPP